VKLGTSSVAVGIIEDDTSTTVAALDVASMDIETPPLDSTVVSTGMVPLLENTSVGVLEIVISI